MTNQIQFINMKDDSRIEKFVQVRLEKLEKRFNWIINARVFLKIDKFPDERNKLCEVELSVPGPNLFSKSNETTFEEAIDNTFDELERQLKKHKAKMYAR